MNDKTGTSGNPASGISGVPRLLGVFAAGRIMNPRTARSQLMGGLISGMSSALHEATEPDERYARCVNDNLADYLVPVNADTPSVEVIMLSGQDKINPTGAQGPRRTRQCRHQRRRLQRAVSRDRPAHPQAAGAAGEDGDMGPSP